MQKIMMLLVVSCSMLSATRFSPECCKPDASIVAEKVAQLRCVLSQVDTVEEKNLEEYYSKTVAPLLYVSVFSSDLGDLRALIKHRIESNITFLGRQLSFRPRTPVTSPRGSQSPVYP